MKTARAYHSAAAELAKTTEFPFRHYIYDETGRQEESRLLKDLADRANRANEDVDKSLAHTPNVEQDIRSLTKQTLDIRPSNENKREATASAFDQEFLSAATSGQWEKASELIEKGASVNAVDDQGWTALHMAAVNGDFKGIEFLVRTDGIDLDMRTHQGETVTRLAEKQNIEMSGRVFHTIAFWKSAAKLPDRVPREPEEIDMKTQAEDTRLVPSRVFPNLPLHELNSFPVGSNLEGEYLANIAQIGLIICKTFSLAKQVVDDNSWPQYADGEIDALERVYVKMQVKADTQHRVDIELVENLAEEYVGQLFESSEARDNFMSAKWTVWHLSIDFANTIGYGGGLDAALDWAKNSRWLG